MFGLAIDSIWHQMDLHKNMVCLALNFRGSNWSSKLAYDLLSPGLKFQRTDDTVLPCRKPNSAVSLGTKVGPFWITSRFVLLRENKNKILLPSFWKDVIWMIAALFKEYLPSNEEFCFEPKLKCIYNGTNPSV
jgi:hypothetical protein